MCLLSINFDSLLKVAINILNEIRKLHHKGILHRDIKLENIIVDGFGNIRIIDFGLAKYAPNGINDNNFLGTPPYIAKECYDATPFYSSSSDSYALGYVLAAIFKKMKAANYALSGPDELTVLREAMKIACTDYKVPQDLQASNQTWISSHYDNMLNTIVECLLCSDWERRPPIENTLEFLHVIRCDRIISAKGLMNERANVFRQAFYKGVELQFRICSEFSDPDKVVTIIEDELKNIADTPNALAGFIIGLDDKALIELLDVASAHGNPLKKNADFDSKGNMLWVNSLYTR